MGLSYELLHLYGIFQLMARVYRTVDILVHVHCVSPWCEIRCTCSFRRGLGEPGGLGETLD